MDPGSGQHSAALNHTSSLTLNSSADLIFLNYTTNCNITVLNQNTPANRKINDHRTLTPLSPFMVISPVNFMSP